MPVSTVLSVARQIADALDAAHSRNIIHRDLKPGNIKLTPDGVVKVLDLGIAKVLSDGESRDAITALTSAGTRTGTIVGTVAYMSPEQARGGAIDKRSDIWAFGCVLYEMLTGRRAYSGDDVSDVATGHDPRPPDFELLPSDTPVAVQRLLRRCLEPDPKRRLRDIADAWAELEDSQAPLPARAPRVLGEVRWPLWVAAAAVVVVLGIGVAIAPRLQLSPVDQSVREFSLEPPEGTNFSNGIALSPDGRRLAFVAGNAFGGNSFRPNTLWVRELDALHADEIAGTSGAQLPFWKPDGSAIGFFSNGKLMTVRLDVRQPVPLTDIPFPPSGGSWNSAGVIIFAGHRSGVFSIPETGGSPKPVTRLRPAQDLAHMWPQFLPDGDRFLYLVLGEKAANRGTYVASLSAPESKRIFTSRELVQYASPGWLVFPRNGQLRAQRFDADRLEVSGDELLVADSVWTVSPEGGAAVSVSGETLMYRVAGTRATSQPVWFDRTGNRLGVVGEPGQYQSIALSRDGSQLAAELHDLRTWDGDLHIFDLRRGGSRSRLTVDGVHNGQPVWSQKGDRILYTGRPAGEVNLHVKALGSDIDEALLPRGPDRSATDWSPDGFHILYDERASEDASGLRTQFDLWTLKLPERAPRRLLSS
jgi:serine/threonine protein kinase